MIRCKWENTMEPSFSFPLSDQWLLYIACFQFAPKTGKGTLHTHKERKRKIKSSTTNKNSHLVPNIFRCLNIRVSFPVWVGRWLFGTLPPSHSNSQTFTFDELSAHVNIGTTGRFIVQSIIDFLKPTWLLI